ncbi:MAG: hypothetical protein JSV88_21160 [Candidatus Aminicenantes bacterium]|nr:MAG: hypothetical protein JSV88_21160 [Candidatus Aminicenantes bacterium]
MLRKILKSKEKRDTALLIVMAVVTILFLLYIFIPSNSGKEKNKTRKPIDRKQQKKIEKKPPIKEEPLTKLGDEEKKQLCDELNRRLKQELKVISHNIITSDTPFENLWLKGLNAILAEFKSDILNKFYKFSFYDLNDVVTLSFPCEPDDPLKFNIFLSMFLIKLEGEGIAKKLQEFSGKEFEEIININPYQLINNEVQEDYQLIPVLFYFNMLMKRLPIYPAEDNTHFFKEKIKTLRDLTAVKYLVQTRELLRFSQSTGQFRLQWVEHDPIVSDDKKVYRHLNFKTFNFLGQKYLIFPDPETPDNNLWIKELCEADSRSIELKDLRIMSEDPAHPLTIKKIYYTSINSRFVVVLKEYVYKPVPVELGGFLNAMVKKRMADFHKNLTCIDFLKGEDEEGKEIFKKQLNQFGIYLKENKISD